MEREPKPQFEIREASVDDMEGLRHMQADSWLATYPNEDSGVPYEWVKEYTDSWFTPDHLERSKDVLAEVINKPNGYYRLAEQDGKIVGFVHASTHDDGTKELEAIYIHPSTFGSGLGHKLMTCAQEWAGDAQMSLEVVAYNDRAIRFYEKHGFEKVEGSEYVYMEKMPVIKMIRKGGNDEI